VEQIVIHKYTKLQLKVLQTFYKHRFKNHLYLLTFLLNCMEQNPSCEANQFAASQEIPHILWKLMVHYCMQKWPPPVPILRQISPCLHIPLP